MRILGVILMALASLQDSRDEEIRRLIARLRSEDVQEREESRRRLSALGKAALPELEKVARDPDAEVSARVRELIERIRFVEGFTGKLRTALPDRLDRLLRGDDHDWCLAFLEATRLEGFAPAHPGLRSIDVDPLAARAARGAQSNAERSEVCAAVRRLRLRSAGPDLQKYLGLDKEGDLQIDAAEALAAAGSRASIPALVRLLKDPHPVIRSRIAGALGMMGASEAIPEILPLLEESLPPALVAFVAGGLARLDAREALPGFEKLLLSESSATRSVGIFALGLLGAPASAEKLRQLMTDADPDLRSRVVEALGRLEDPANLPALKKSLEDPEGRVREAAILALANGGDREVVPRLMDLLDGGRIEAREQAARRLGWLEAKQAIPNLLSLLQGRNEILMAAPASALADLGAREAVGPLTELLKTASAPGRVFLPEALGRLGGEGSVPLLLDLLRDKESGVRVVSARALCRIGRTEGVPILLEEGEGLMLLNAVRQPRGWMKLADHPIREPRRGTAARLIEELAGETGFRVLFPESPEFALDSWKRHRCRVPLGGRGQNGLGLLGRVLGDEADALLEGDDLRIVTREEACRFWTAWWADRQKPK